MSAPRTPRAPAGTVHRTIALLHDALAELGATVPLGDVERSAVMLNRAMTVEARSFHTPEHVFDLVVPGRPRTTLAALFHDLVYYQIDQGFVPEVARLLTSSVELRGGAVRLRARVDPADRPLALTLAVFGFAPGQELSPFGGMNEFLSALAMNRTLATAVREEDLLRASACVEATIPFRRPGPGGESPADVLAARLGGPAVRALGLDLPPGAVRETVREAVAFANSDVANFADREVTRFLDNTWKLLPESNPALRIQGMYSVKSYRVALQKMEGFLRSLDPAAIFGRFDGEPPEERYALMRARAERNVLTARDYLGIKLLTSAILEGLAEISGGDAPVSLFMGDIGAREDEARLEDMLPDAPAPADLRLDVTLHDLLAHGRASESSFDLQNSPLSLFVYRQLGADGFRDLLAAARRMFDGAVSPREFLDALPAGLAAPVAEGCARMAFTRRPALEQYAAARAGGGA